MLIWIKIHNVRIGVFFFFFYFLQQQKKLKDIYNNKGKTPKIMWTMTEEENGSQYIHFTGEVKDIMWILSIKKS